MTRKNWIWTVVILAVIHGIIIALISPRADDVLWSRFDGNPYQSIWDQISLILFFMLFIPYYLLTFFLPGPGSNPLIHAILLAANSLIWGLFGAYLISFLPFMKDLKPYDLNDQNNPETSSDPDRS
jgi:hypothetical protein